MCTEPGGPTDSEALTPQLLGTVPFAFVGDSLTVGFSASSGATNFRAICAAKYWPAPDGFCQLCSEGSGGAGFPNSRYFAFSGEVIEAFYPASWDPTGTGGHNIANLIHLVTGTARRVKFLVVMLGTNNASSAASAAGAQERYLALLNYIYYLRPDLRLGLVLIPPKVSDTTNGYTITVRAGQQAAIAAFLVAHPDMVGKVVVRDASTIGLVRSTGVGGDFANDGHPNDAGHAKLGNLLMWPVLKSVAGYAQSIAA